jgi:hypothetical protein
MHTRQSGRWRLEVFAHVAGRHTHPGDEISYVTD